MAALNPAARKRLTLLMLVVGCALVAEQLLSPGPSAANTSDEDLALPVKRLSTADAPPTRLPTTLALQTERLAARRQAAAASAAEVDDPFEAHSWLPPAPPPRPPAPPPPPVAPAFPYTYLGGMLDGEIRTGFFSKGERVVPVRVGDTVDGAYRVDQMTEDQMTLTYLPLNLPLTVALGSAR